MPLPPSLVLDLDDMVKWIDAVQNALGGFQQTLSVPSKGWDPPPVVGLVPLAQPACFRPSDGGTGGTTIADLVKTLQGVRDWLKADLTELQKVFPRM